MDVLELFTRCADAMDTAIGESAFVEGPALWLGTREIAHADGTDEIEIRVTKAVIRARRAEFAQDDAIALREGSSDWLRMRVEAPADVERAVVLIHDAIEANRPTAKPGLPPTGADLERRRRFH